MAGIRQFHWHAAWVHSEARTACRASIFMISPQHSDEGILLNAADDSTTTLPAKLGDGLIAVPLVAETLDVAIRQVETGGVRLVKTVDREVVTVDEPLTRTYLDIQHVAIGRPIDAVPIVRYEGDTTILPVVEEVLIVEKRLVLKEEVRITQRKSEFRDPQQIELKSERVTVEPINSKN